MIDSSDFATLDNRYVQKDDCNDKHASLSTLVTQLEVAQAKTNTQLSWLVKLTAASTTAVLGAVLTAIVNLVVSN